MGKITKTMRGVILAAILAIAASVFCLSPAFAEDAYAAESGTLSDSVSWSLDDSGYLQAGAENLQP